jgi:CDP-diglyceride synthetase
MKQRVLTGAVLIFIVTLAFLLRELNLYIFDSLLAVVIVLASAEVSRVFLRSGRANFMEMTIVYPVLVFMFYMWGINASFVFSQFLLSQLGLLAVMFAVSFLLSYLQKEKLKKDELYKVSKKSIYEFSMEKALRTLFVMVYPTVLLSFLYLMNHLGDLRLSSVAITAYAPLGRNFGLIILTLTILTTIMADTFAYFVGSQVGGKKLAPFISPKKTISGAIGGIVGSMIFATIMFLALNSLSVINTAFFQAEIGIWHFIIYGFFASIVSQAGDLFASYIKRKARAKDFSSIFPGHGGFMDRLDGISTNAVFTFIFVMLFFV